MDLEQEAIRLVEHLGERYGYNKVIVIFKNEDERAYACTPTFTESELWETLGRACCDMISIEGDE